MIAGVDEAGRGPWAGPVVAAACILPPVSRRRAAWWREVTDSKQLSAATRERLFPLLTAATQWAVGIVEASDIDALGIKAATHLAMAQAVKWLSQQPTQLLIDGNDLFPFAIPAEYRVRGDASEPAISAASIIAKVVRDRLMVRYDQLYPGYGFAAHKGYGTAQHWQALQDRGVCLLHRLSYAPVARCAGGRKPTLLLHICCAPDATTPLERLAEQYDLTGYWYNPNIRPRAEYDQRLTEMKKLAARLNIPLKIGRYAVADWQAATRGLEQEPEKGRRCEKCIAHRLQKSWEYARAHHFDWWATSLTTSPHKVAEFINAVGQQLASGSAAQYLESNFKKQNGYLRSVELCRQYKIWRQNYCGCRPPLDQMTFEI